MRSFADITINVALVAACSAYAKWLESDKSFEPDFTWAEVAVGTALCLVAAGLQSRLRGGDWRSHEREVAHALALGAAPVVIGELSQWLERREERQRYMGLRQ